MNQMERDAMDRKFGAAKEAAKIEEESQGARERLEALAANLRDAKLPEGQTPKEVEIISKVRTRLVKLAQDILDAASKM